MAHRHPSANPPTALGHNATRVLLAISQGATTYGQIMQAVGISRQVTHHHVHRLLDEGLIAMDAGKIGTIRPRVQQVPLPA